MLYCAVMHSTVSALKTPHLAAPTTTIWCITATAISHVARCHKVHMPYHHSTCTACMMCSIALLHQARQGRGHAARCMKHQPKRLLRSPNCPVPELPVFCPQASVKVLTAAVLLAPSFSANFATRSSAPLLHAGGDCNRCPATGQS